MMLCGDTVSPAPGLPYDDETRNVALLKPVPTHPN
jgi:hypothetical protein